MIRICPAILTNSLEELKRELKEYSQLFDQIDVDINVENDAFKGENTVGIDVVLEEIKNYPTIKFNFHLMVEKPLEFVEKLMKNTSQINKIFIHQEYINNEIIQMIPFEMVGVVVADKLHVDGLEFYRQFSEVQIMTVEPGEQGKFFVPLMIYKSKQLQDMGYTGQLSVDGGVNTESATVIRNYEINRVSVGSFFSKSYDLTNSLFELNGVLNKLTIEE